MRVNLFYVSKLQRFIMTLHHTLVSSPYGNWSISDNGEYIVGFDYWSDSSRCTNDSPLGLEARSQVLAYLSDASFKFDLPLLPTGTDFQKKIWQLMIEISVGCTRTYGDVATELGSAARAVGGACRANPIPLLIPCHRIIAKQGLGGFSGQSQGLTLTLKEQLLRHEGAL